MPAIPDKRRVFTLAARLARCGLTAPQGQTEGKKACVLSFLAELRRQKTDDLRGIVERRADIAVDVLDRLIETASSRKLTSREADMGDEALHSLRMAIADLESHRASRFSRDESEHG